MSGAPWRSLSDRRVEMAMGALLRAGVALAAALVLAGGITYLARAGGTQTHYGTFHGVEASLRSPAEVVRSAAALHPDGLIQLGLLVLVVTPIMRVAFSALAFAVQHDRLYVVLTMIVLAILLLGLSGHTP